MSNKYPKREVTLKITIVLGRCGGRQKWRASCQRLNTMEMSERFFLTCKSLLLKKAFTSL